METFYGGLNRASQMAAGRLMDKSYTEAKEILDHIAKHNMEWMDDTYDGRADRKKRSQNVNSIDSNAIATLSTQVAMMTSLLQNITLGNGSNQQKVNQVEAFGQPMVSCVGCGDPHFYAECSQNPQRKSSEAPPRGEPSAKEWTAACISTNASTRSTPFNRGGQTSSSRSTLENLLKEYIAQNDALLKIQASSIRNLEIQVGQIANELKSRQPRVLPSNIETPRNNNGKEQCHMVTLRSGKALEKRRMNSRNSSPLKERITRSMDQEKRMPETTSHSEPSTFNVRKPEVTLNAPFPRHLMKKNDEQQFKRFFKLLKQLHINIPLIEALEQMPTYVKFFKDILTKKKRVSEKEVIALTQKCNALVSNSVPNK
ncbi:uncharacterized protein LOC120084967 [Benincasa hispida]|uniref:uncharacterized protein LOC120084967 n=1 Tax=Benincasa hispida TaxID=102211 RepID=UPI0019014F6D|nr:uncharacterized protein LOC120084967 [Benincasa hispida]